MKKTVEERNNKLAQERDLLIDMDPEVARIFSQSTSISTSKGISSHLLKPSAKRRRTKKQVQEDKLAAAKKQIEIENKIAAYDSMQAKVELAEAQSQEASKVHSQLQKLIGQGILRVGESG